MNDIAPAARTDLEPIGLMISSLVRKSPFIVLAVALAGAAAWFGLEATESEIDEQTATSRIGVTNEVVWPFYDVALEHGRVMVDDPQFETDLESDVGFPISSISTSVPDLLSVFDIEVVAGNAEQAVLAADRAAAMVVERGIEEQTAAATAGIEALDEQLAEIDARIAERRAKVDAANARIEEIAALQAQEFDQVLDEERWRLSLQRDIDQGILVDSERNKNGLLNQRSSLVNAVAPEPEYEVLRLAEQSTSDRSLRLPLTLAVAFVALIAAAAVAIVVDRRRGKIRHEWQLRHVCGARDTLRLTGVQGRLSGVEPLVDRLHVASSAGDRLVGLVDATSERFDLAQFTRQFAEHGISAALTVSPEPLPGTDVTFVDVSHEYASGDSPRIVSRQCDRILIVTGRHTSVEHARDVIERSETTPGVIAIAFVDGR